MFSESEHVSSLMNFYNIGQPTRSEHGAPGEPPSSLHVMTEDDSKLSVLMMIYFFIVHGSCTCI